MLSREKAIMQQNQQYKCTTTKHPSTITTIIITNPHYDFTTIAAKET
jgi:hypothetical protein